MKMKYTNYSSKKISVLLEEEMKIVILLLKKTRNYLVRLRLTFVRALLEAVDFGLVKTSVEY